MYSNQHLQAMIPIATHRDFTHLGDEAASRSILMLPWIFFFFFSKINTYSFFKAVIFFQKKTNDLVKIGSFKNYQVSHTPRPFELEQQQSML